MQQLDSIRNYETVFAKRLGVPNAFSFYKGRVALYAILKALEVSEGDYVIFPGFTCIMVPNAAIYLGARPVYVDIEPYNYNMDVSNLEAVLLRMTSEEIKKTKAIVVQHTFGIPAEMDAIMDVAARYQIPVIEDCAHAVGSRYGGRQLGTIGIASFFSSQWSKPYCTGLGGMSVTADPVLATKLRIIQSSFTRPGRLESGVLGFQMYLHNKIFSPSLYWTSMDALRAFSAAGIFIGSSSKIEYAGEMPEGYEKVMGDNQAAAGIVAIDSIDKSIVRRKELAAFYSGELGSGSGGLRLDSKKETVLLRYPVMVNDKDAVLAEARRKRAEIGSWFETVLHPARSGLDKAGYRMGSCPVGEKTARHIVNLPTHSKVGQEDARRSLMIISGRLMRNKKEVLP